MAEWVLFPGSHRFLRGWQASMIKVCYEVVNEGAEVS